MSKFVDVHLLHLPEETNIAGEISHPSINVHHLDGIEGNTLQARINAFSVGDAPYVSFVDPDDYVIMESFDRCVDVLESNSYLGGVYTNSEIINQFKSPPDPLMFHNHEWSLEWHTNHPKPIHQLVVMRRDVVQQAIADIPENSILRSKAAVQMSEQLIYAHVAKLAPWKFLNFVGYRWFKRPNGSHLGNQYSDPEFVRKYIKQLLG